jgi:predicted permease
VIFEVVTITTGLALVVLAVLFLRRRGVLNASHSELVETLLIQIVLPADIIFDLSQATLRSAHLKMILTLATTGLINLLLGYLLGRLLRLQRPQVGALMLSVGFAETALIAVPVLKALYPGQTAMHADVIVCSEIGVVLPTLILGPIIAQVFGERAASRKPAYLILSALRDYVRSPLCIALIIGLVISATNIHTGSVLSQISDRMLEATSSGLTFLSLVFIGLILKPAGWRRFWPALLIVVCMQQIADPLLINGVSRLFTLQPAEIEVMRILSLTPAALVAPAFAARHKCAPELSASLTCASVASVLILFPLMYSLMR